PSQASDFAIRHIAAAPGRMQPGPEKRLVRVNVPHAGDDALIEQHRFEAAARACQAVTPVLPVEIERLRPEAGPDKKLLEGRVVAHEFGTAKPAHVAEAQLETPSIQVGGKVRVVFRGRPGRSDSELTG